MVQIFKNNQIDVNLKNKIVNFCRQHKEFNMDNIVTYTQKTRHEIIQFCLDNNLNKKTIFVKKPVPTLQNLERYLRDAKSQDDRRLQKIAEYFECDLLQLFVFCKKSTIKSISKNDYLYTLQNLVLELNQKNVYTKEQIARKLNVTIKLVNSILKGENIFKKKFNLFMEVSKYKEPDENMYIDNFTHACLYDK